MRFVIMDEVAQNVAHLTEYILSTLSPDTSRPDNRRVDCFVAGGLGSSSFSDGFEGTPGFTDHTKFLQNLFGGPGNWKLGKQSSPPRLLARICSPAKATKERKASEINKNDRNLSDAQDGVEIEVVGPKFESSASEPIRILFEGSSATESYGSPSPSSLDSLVNNEVNYGSAVSKEDLGRATWTFLHTLAAQFPEYPTKRQQRDAKELMTILSRIYPCKECADHFKDVLKAHPVDAKSGEQLAQWMCRVHNVVNRSLGKAQFPCNRVDFRWGALDCNEGACDLHGKLYR